MSSEPVPPVEFQRATADLMKIKPRVEIELEVLPAPKRLAPFSYAIGAAVIDPESDQEIATGRLVFLHDPAGVRAWDGTSRIVIFVTSEIEGEMATDPFLAEATWSLLTDALAANDTDYASLGGTVTSTSSTRFGDLTGERRTDDLEIRASWTPLSGEFGRNMTTFCQLLAAAAGLPPEGVGTIGPSTPRPQH